MKDIVFCIFSRPDENVAGSNNVQLMLNDKVQLISAAEQELNQAGITLKNLAGVEWLSNSDAYTPRRELSYEESWKLAVEQFNSNGRYFAAFDDTAEGRMRFISEAETCGLGAEARAMVEKIYDGKDLSENS